MQPRPTAAAIRIVDIDSDLRSTALVGGYSVSVGSRTARLSTLGDFSMYVDQMPLHDRISALNLPTGSYALAGDAGLAAYGLLEAGRIDLIVSPEVFRGLPERGWNALPGTDGMVLANGDVTARTRLHNLSHLSTIDFVSDVDQVAGLPVLRLPVLRQSVAASGATRLSCGDWA